MQSHKYFRRSIVFPFAPLGNEAAAVHTCYRHPTKLSVLFDIRAWFIKIRNILKQSICGLGPHCRCSQRRSSWRTCCPPDADVHAGRKMRHMVHAFQHRSLGGWAGCVPPEAHLNAGEFDTTDLFCERIGFPFSPQFGLFSLSSDLNYWVFFQSTTRTRRDGAGWHTRQASQREYGQ